MKVATVAGLAVAGIGAGCSGSSAPVTGGSAPETPWAAPAQADAGGATYGADAASGSQPRAECTSDELHGLKTGAAQWQTLCARGYQDPIAKAFCTASPPTIKSITDLQKLIGLDFKPGVLT